ncbi:MAG: hypothetical protein DRH51_06965 [Candidatus Coatesbacteria bacterium]|nr:MAG: hypothetical protein DRH51_06965 [Candidatus Coatesbacteria bacterium]
MAVCPKNGKWCIYWWGHCFCDECLGAKIFPSHNGAERLSVALSEREKREVRELYEVIRQSAVPNDPKDKVSVAQAKQAKEDAEYWLSCYYFKTNTVEALKQELEAIRAERRRPLTKKTRKRTSRKEAKTKPKPEIEQEAEWV